MNEREMEAAARELEMLRMQLDNLNRQDELIQVTLEEYNRARDALGELKGKEEGSEILVPIGANIWVRATLGKVDKAIASIGSNVAVGQKLDEVIDRLNHQLEEIGKADTELSGKITAVEARVRDLTAVLQEVYGEMDGHHHSH